MADNGEGGFGLWTVIKAVLITVGLIYLVSLFTWFAQWAVVLVALGGGGYLTYRVTRALFGSNDRKQPRQLTSESPFNKRLRELEDEERLLDHKIGL